MHGPRTVDRIFAGETLKAPNGVFGWDSWPPPILATEQDWRDMSSPVIAIDNVLEYLVREKSEDWDISTLPVVAPPFPSFWADCSLPVDAAWNREGSPWKKGASYLPTRFAVFFYAIRIDRDSPHRDDESVKGVIRLQQLLDEAFADDDPVDSVTAIPEDAAWYLETVPFFAGRKVHGKKRIIGPLASMGFFLDSDGKLPKSTALIRMKAVPSQISNPSSPDYVPPVEGEKDLTASEEKSMFAAFLGMLTYPAFFAVSLMHCKNVETVEYTPTPKEQKAARKKTGRELVSFHTLVVDARPTRRYLPSEERQTSVSDRARPGLHIVRGHFKTFTKDAPLLGKAVGTFWWGQHVRGDEEEGLIAKDYDVRA